MGALEELLVQPPRPRSGGKCIFSGGPILKQVQISNALGDGKSFVDLLALHPVAHIQEKWDRLVEDRKDVSAEEVKGFLADNFGSHGWELQRVAELEGWVEQPAYLTGISCDSLRRVGVEIHKIWKHLSARVDESVMHKRDQTSMLYVPHPVVIPGGRFRENYYWDNYWIVKGLLASGLTTSAKSIILNNFYLLQEYGLIPNGTRSYYLNRSQPPMLTSMVEDYVVATKDTEILRENIHLLVKEMEWWLQHRTVVVDTGERMHTMFRYDAAGVGPRPESYREDVETVEKAQCLTEEDAELKYRHLKAAAESGWDFSSRWLIDDKGGNTGGLVNIATTHIIPVDLNSILYRNFLLIDRMLRSLGLQGAFAHDFGALARKLKTAITEVLYDADERMWFDYDFINQKPRKFYYASNLTPLWAECYDAAKKEEVARDCVAYLRKENAILPGGLVTSNTHSGEQWDFPNVWAPCQHFVADGLVRTEDPEARELALLIAMNFVDNAKEALANPTGAYELFEKYDGRQSGSAGYGGEYTVQSGFGWTNGVIIEFIRGFGDSLSTPYAKI